MKVIVHCYEENCDYCELNVFDNIQLASEWINTNCHPDSCIRVFEGNELTVKRIRRFDISRKEVVVT